MCIYNVSCVKDDIGVFYTRSEKLEKEASQMSPINQSEKNLIECLFFPPVTTRRLFSRDFLSLEKYGGQQSFLSVNFPLGIFVIIATQHHA